MFNKKQIASLAKMSYKVAEITFAGIIIAGVMQPTPRYGLIIFGLAVFPLPVLVGLVLESAPDSDDRPP